MLLRFSDPFYDESLAGQEVVPVREHIPVSVHRKRGEIEPLLSFVHLADVEMVAASPSMASMPEPDFGILL